MAAVAATCSRRSNRSRASGDSEVGNSIRITPGMVWVLTGKAAVAEHLDHLVVLGQHLGIQHLDADLVGRLGELAEQDRAEPIALHGVGDLQGHLRPLGMIGLALEAGVADHSAVGAGGGDQPVAAVVVDLGGPLDGLLQVGEAGEEAQPAALVGQAPQQLLDRGRVGAPGRPHVHGRAVPQDDVGLPMPGIGGHGHHSSSNRTSTTPGTLTGQQGGQLAAGRVGGAGELDDPVAHRRPVRAGRAQFGRQQGLQVPGDVPVAAGEHRQQVPPGHDADDLATPDDRDGLDAPLEHEPARLRRVGILGQRDHRPGHDLGGHPGDAGGRGWRRGEVGPGVGGQLQGEEVGLGHDADQLVVVHHRHGADPMSHQQVGDLFEPHVRRHRDHRARHHIPDPHRGLLARVWGQSGRYPRAFLGPGGTPGNGTISPRRQTAPAFSWHQGRDEGGPNA